MEGITVLLMVAILVEAVSEWIKDVVDSKVRWKKLMALGVSITIVFTLDLDLFHLLGLDPAFPLVGGLLLSILVSRGSNFIHDLLDKARDWKGGA